FRSAFSLAHTSFSRFLGNRLVREQANPHLAAALDKTRHRDTSRFDLPVRHPAAAHRLQSVIAERQRRAAPRLAGHAAALLLPVFHLLWHQHGVKISSNKSPELRTAAARRRPCRHRLCPFRPRPAPASIPVSSSAAAERPAEAESARPFLADRREASAPECPFQRPAERSSGPDYVAVPARHTPWFRLIAQTARARAFQNLALIHPALHSDNAVRGMRLGETVIDIGAKRVQRQLPLQIPLAARDLVSVQTARNPDFNSLAAEPQRGIDRLAHRSPERHAFFQLQRNRLGHKLRVQFRLMHFLNVDEHFALGALGEIALQLLDLRAFASDDDAGPRCADRHAKLIAWAVDFNRAQAGRLEASVQGLLQLDVFAEQLRVIRLREPPRPPGLGDAQPESIWMYFLSHALPTCSLRSSPGRRL